MQLCAWDCSELLAGALTGGGPPHAVPSRPAALGRLPNLAGFQQHLGVFYSEVVRLGTKKILLAPETRCCRVFGVLQTGRR